MYEDSVFKLHKIFYIAFKEFYRKYIGMLFAILNSNIS
ncbi:hypothetical protein Desaci_1856 [Desulfosporosinus acidiphilus SJ4]|uniref:Uncharacterized protein n=1 Tax=Desulfosporosinus acidiphilus (strain DSM 22704 / JCM 16185 / SJ4) TaxID=646529 RepID=I4D4W1_DESAJ|nr:hypothetical protein Desaci_1856 [Desulfosporosinus acidiphilus SJ4]